MRDHTVSPDCFTSYVSPWEIQVLGRLPDDPYSSHMNTPQPGKGGGARPDGRSQNIIQWERGDPRSEGGVLLPVEWMTAAYKPQAVKLEITPYLSMPWSCVAPTKSHI